MIEHLPIGETSRQTGVHIETIRFYERIGMIAAPARSAGRHRLYGPATRQRLSFIRRARELGFSLDSIRSLLDVHGGVGASCKEIHAVAARHSDEIEQKIADLRRMQSTLRDMMALCQRGETPDCPLVEALARPSQ